mmetsp:Transcript_62363/g.158556  ORF Transcript_62363/g.158556 Transcript_62363/m.158556 type:complete len:277 (-) Transcript_62363:183-1013(-)
MGIVAGTCSSTSAPSGKLSPSLVSVPKTRPILGNVKSTSHRGFVHLLSAVRPTSVKPASLSILSAARAGRSCGAWTRTMSQCGLRSIWEMRTIVLTSSRSSEPQPKTMTADMPSTAEFRRAAPALFGDEPVSTTTDSWRPAASSFKNSRHGRKQRSLYSKTREPGSSDFIPPSSGILQPFLLSTPSPRVPGTLLSSCILLATPSLPLPGTLLLSSGILLSKPSLTAPGAGRGAGRAAPVLVPYFGAISNGSMGRTARFPRPFSQKESKAKALAPQR